MQPKKQTLKNKYLSAIKNRDNEVIQSIYNDFFDKVYGFVAKNNGSQQDAKDIFDMAIYQISARLHKEEFTIKTSFEAYLFTACKNLWRRQLNKKAKQRVTNNDVKELYYEEKQLAQSTMEQERWELFEEKLNDLSQNCFEILSLFFKNISGQEIMKKMNYGSENTVRQRIFKCKKQLIKLVKQDARFLELKTK